MQNYRQTNYDVSLDLYTQLLDSAEPVCALINVPILFA